MDNKRIADIIHSYRLEKRLSQEKLGEILGVSGQAVSKWEQGSAMPDILMLPALCDVLGITPNELFDFSKPLERYDPTEDFCIFARKNGIGKTVMDAVSRLFSDSYKPLDANALFLSDDELRISNQQNMCFMLDMEKYREARAALRPDAVASFLNVFINPNCLAVLNRISLGNAVSREELTEELDLDPQNASSILIELLDHKLITTGIDDNGKRGYIADVNFAAAAMILMGCGLSGCSDDNKQTPRAIWLSYWKAKS